MSDSIDFILKRSTERISVLQKFVTHASQKRIWSERITKVSGCLTIGGVFWFLIKGTPKAIPLVLFSALVYSHQNPEKNRQKEDAYTLLHQLYTDLNTKCKNGIIDEPKLSTELWNLESVLDSEVKLYAHLQSDAIASLRN